MSTPHHQIFEKFQPFCGTVPNGHEYDFLGTQIRPEYIGMRGSGERISVSTTYPYPDDEYFEWIDLLESVVLSGPEYTFMELGAGIGRWSVRAAFACIQQQKNCHLVAVEAEPNHYQWMRMHFSENGLDPEAHTLLHAAVTDVLGEIPFYIEAPYGGAPDAWYGQFIANPYDEVDEIELRTYQELPIRRHRSGCRSVAVPGVSLDTLLQNHNGVDLIDFDIQGHELSVISASIDTLNKKVKRLHIGTHSREIELGLRELLGNHGWSCIADHPGEAEGETAWGRFQFQDGVQSWINPGLKQ